MLTILNMRDYLTWPRAMAERLAAQGHEVVLLDNASTWKPLLNWYATCPFEVIHLTVNGGHHSPWTHLTDRMNAAGVYAVSDPDLNIDALPDDWETAAREAHQKFGADKVGLGLDDRFIPTLNPAWRFDHFYNYPDGDSPQNLGLEIGVLNNGAKVYHRPTDTTFAIYFNRGSGIGGIRLGRPYSAYHMPWHIVPRLKNDGRITLQYLMDEEIRYYFAHASDSSMTKPRMKLEGLI